jgi:hypothetical protein
MGIFAVCVVGATSVIRVARKETSSKLWATKLLERKPARVVSVALAKKTAHKDAAVVAQAEHRRGCGHRADRRGGADH